MSVEDAGCTSTNYVDEDSICAALSFIGRLQYRGTPEAPWNGIVNNGTSNFPTMGTTGGWPTVCRTLFGWNSYTEARDRLKGGTLYMQGASHVPNKGSYRVSECPTETLTILFKYV